MAKSLAISRKTYKRNVLLITKPTVKPDEHDRIVQQLKDMGYGVAEGRVSSMANIKDVTLEDLPIIEG